MKGKSDEDIKQFLVDKYGDWILMTPPFDPYTYVLWLSPAIIILFGFGYIYYKSRKELKQCLYFDTLQLLFDHLNNLYISL